jgi:hypothetical protein
MSDLKSNCNAQELIGLPGYYERGASELEPFTLCQIDGHRFKEYITHPTTGAHYDPEVCGVICLTIKVFVGWSCGITESCRTVSVISR